MKKIYLLVLIICISISLTGFINRNMEAPSSNDSQQTDESEKNAVKAIVESFGKKLKMVPLLAPPDIVSKSMDENYGDYVSAELIANWKKYPENAPGRLVSSPWPDRIEIASVEKISDGLYEVKGEIVELTSVEQEKGGVAAKRPVRIEVKKFDEKWLIVAVTLL